jgi:hypothetical protein
MSNILVESLDEVYETAESEMAGGGGEKLKALISGMLDSCEAEDPQTDIAFQFEHLIDDIGVVQRMLTEAVAAKLAAKPGI